jgi:hypothetical protein
VTYLDGDLFFFGSPETIFGELENAAFGIIPHRYTPELERLRKFGIYNVGWVSVLNGTDGIAIVKWWRDKCVEWCYDYVDGDRFADQGYLQMLAARFARVKVIENVGANLAPWNIGNYHIEFRDSKVLIGSVWPLMFFHFQGVKRGVGCFIFNSHRIYGAPFSSTIRNHIYRPYIDELLAIEQDVGSIVDVTKTKPLSRTNVNSLSSYIKSIVRNIRDRLFRILDIVTGRAFLILRGKAF